MQRKETHSTIYAFLGFSFSFIIYTKVWLCQLSFQHFSRRRDSIRFWISIISTLHPSTLASSFVMQEMMSCFFRSKAALLPLIPGRWGCSSLSRLWKEEEPAHDFDFMDLPSIIQNRIKLFHVRWFVIVWEKENIHRQTRSDYYYRTYGASFHVPGRYCRKPRGVLGVLISSSRLFRPGVRPNLNQINNFIQLQPLHPSFVLNHDFRWDSSRDRSSLRVSW